MELAKSETPPLGQKCLVEFTPTDAPKLAAFNAVICEGLPDRRGFYAHDEAFYQKYTGGAGWTIGFALNGEVISTDTFIRDLEAFRRNWVFPMEEYLLRTPSVWWLGHAIAPIVRKTTVSMELRAQVIAFLKSKGMPSAIGVTYPTVLRARQDIFAQSIYRIVGLYYDDDGWNLLGGLDWAFHDDRISKTVTAWAFAKDEAALLEQFCAGRVGLACRDRGPAAMTSGLPLSASKDARER